MTSGSPSDRSDPQGFAGQPGPVDDEAQWRRPAADAPSLPPPVPPPPTEPVAYAGPPPTDPPPAGWRPPLVVQAPPPRALPAQDLLRLDEAEQRARTLTYGIAMVAGAVMILVVLVLCGRVLL
ncbi:translation initiation factor 2 [Planosporangium thailandense]|uniref:Translation initiation factor 2 n=1 Tax=Planosporangium thailandense TaxID=765197 RepID=A0ABX0XVU9_9ACTN|nr:translation initiation factor 2 [Planosporangium thailandense]